MASAISGTTSPLGGAAATSAWMPLELPNLSNRPSRIPGFPSLPPPLLPPHLSSALKVNATPASQSAALLRQQRQQQVAQLQHGLHRVAVSTAAAAGAAVEMFSDGEDGSGSDGEGPKVGSRRSRGKRSGSSSSSSSKSSTRRRNAGAESKAETPNPGETAAGRREARGSAGAADSGAAAAFAAGSREQHQQQQQQEEAEELQQGWKREPSVVCLGEGVVEFVPNVRPCDRQAPHLELATWRNMQWVPPEFARAPGGPSCQVALALSRMGTRVAFVGRVGDDLPGHLLREKLREYGVNTDGLLGGETDRMMGGLLGEEGEGDVWASKAEEEDKDEVEVEWWVRTGVSRLRLAEGEDGRWYARSVGLPLLKQQAAVEELLGSPNVEHLLSRASWLHCTALSFTSDADTAAAILALIDPHVQPAPNSSPTTTTTTAASSTALAPTSGTNPLKGPASPPSPRYARLVLDPNLPLLLWRSRAVAWEALRPAWCRASVVELSRAEAEFLLGEGPYVRRRDARCKYVADSFVQLRAPHDDAHYSREEVAPLWSPGVTELLLIADGTLVVHYYTAEFDGAVDGTEDVLVASMTCDRSGSGDAMLAALLSKLAARPWLLHDQAALERAIRYAISAGVIAQWTTGAARSFPTAEAAQNLTEQMFLTSLITEPPQGRPASKLLSP